MVPVREPMIVPVREPIIVPVRDPIIVPAREPALLDLDPMIVPPNETVANERVKVVAITMCGIFAMTDAPCESFSKLSSYRDREIGVRKPVFNPAINNCYVPMLFNQYANAGANIGVKDKCFIMNAFWLFKDLNHLWLDLFRGYSSRRSVGV